MVIYLTLYGNGEIDVIMKTWRKVDKDNRPCKRGQCPGHMSSWHLSSMINVWTKYWEPWLNGNRETDLFMKTWCKFSKAGWPWKCHFTKTYYLDSEQTSLYSYSYMLHAAYLAKMQQITIIKSLVWPNMGWTPQFITQGQYANHYHRCSQKINLLKFHLPVYRKYIILFCVVLFVFFFYVLHAMLPVSLNCLF